MRGASLTIGIIALLAIAGAAFLFWDATRGALEGTIISTEESTRTVTLSSAERGRVTLALAEDTELLGVDGQEITLADLRRGSRVEVDGRFNDDETSFIPTSVRVLGEEGLETEEVTMSVGETDDVDGLMVQLVRVVEDTRCVAGATSTPATGATTTAGCPQGEGAVTVEVSLTPEDAEATAATTTQISENSEPLVFGDYVLSIVSVTPEAQATPIVAEDYRVRLRVEHVVDPAAETPESETPQESVQNENGTGTQVQ